MFLKIFFWVKGVGCCLFFIDYIDFFWKESLYKNIGKYLNLKVEKYDFF